ncbi:ABC transporter ATP-binding protein [Vogesella sp. LIG4]|uniref:ABC transporter ATP-binding protein n=1 Tax=Vogesella sp. LIG4 TaxID=1192162 RepID=UPI00081FC38A|nr:ABC transporter ATP-binding protein [Vogesella sp. LIG4]SCK15325.1 iron(III) transport system ATP-binding protein [Vogesella sp. LIG4]
MSTLEISQLGKWYAATPAVDAVSLQVAAGSRTAIVGPSGSGKTTLLRMIAGFEFPDAGSIRLDGSILADERGAVPAHQRGIGYVPQDGALFPHLTVADNIGFGLPGRARDKLPRVRELLERVALDQAMLKRWPHELSGGQQQRVALARALAQQPRLMLLDEPFSALDTGLRAEMRKTVSQLLAAAGITTILVTHDQAEALSFAHQLAVMRRGRLVQAGSPAELYRYPADEDTALFLGEAVILPASIEHGRAHCVLGALPTRDTAPTGAARIMLRPEQLQIRPLPAQAAAESGCLGTVTEVDFGGHSSLLGIRLQAGDGATPLLQVKYSGLATPQPGSTVQISVDGQAHVLA